MVRHEMGGLLFLLMVAGPMPARGAEAAAPVDQLAAEIVRFSGAPGGVCAIVGGQDAALATAIARQGSFVVHGLCADPATCDGWREAIVRSGQYGPVSAHTWVPGRLPYTENLVNIVVVAGEKSPDPFLPQEVLRVLAPLGVAYLGVPPSAGAGRSAADELTDQLRTLDVEDLAVVETGGTWVRLRKPWPAAIDEWTHYLHGADGNPVARDRVVGPPKHYQWIGPPLWLRCHETDSSISTLVTARGRLFYIVDEAPISLPGDHPLPDEWSLMARDAFNGVLLWQVPIRRWGWREWKNSWFNTRPGDIPLNIQKRLVAAGDKVYVTLGYQAPVSELDARTGEILQSYAGTERTGEILWHEGTLVLSMLAGRQLQIAAIDAASGKRLWTSAQTYRGTTVDYIKWREMHGGTEPPELDPSANLATDGRLVALIDGPDLVGLDGQTGRQLWRSAFPLDDADRNAGGMQTEGNLWNGTLIVRDGVVVHASPHRLAALAADTGRVLWSQPKKYIGHLWYEWKDVFVIDGLVWTWTAELEQGVLDSGARKERCVYPGAVNGYDLHTGELKRAVPLGSIFKANHHHRCYRNKATERYILASRRGTEYVDLLDGRHTVDNWVRGTCHVGMMPANGLQYAPPHPCQCYIEEKLNGLLALAPARPTAEWQAGSAAPVLERGPAYEQADGSAASEEDWPVFRHDALRTGSVATQVPEGVTAQWQAALGGRLSPPTAVAGQLFIAQVDAHRVVCLDAQDGHQRWAFTAGGRVDSPPTYERGRVLCGSADGWVYCLRAADGQLVWRFRAAPEERLIGAFGQLESAWPVPGSVLVQNGVAYFVAGRSSHVDGGLFLYGVDAATGQMRHQTRLTGPDYTVDNVQENCRLPLGALPDVLIGDGTRVFLRSLAFDAELKADRGKTELQVKSGFLDDTYFKRTPWTFAGEYANLLSHDNQSVYYVRMFDSLRGLDPTVFFTPGRQGYLLFAKNLAGKRSAWSERVPVRIRAMALTTGRLFVAGPPDVVDARDPLGAFEGRLGGRLYTIDAASGEKLRELALPSPPVFNGLAAARGRLFLTTEDGHVTCFGKPD